MDNHKNTPPSHDPELDALLKLLQDTPERDRVAVERGRARYVTDVNEMFASKRPTFSWWEKFMMMGMFNSSRQQDKGNRPMKLPYSIAFTALIIALFLFSGAGITAYAAQSALPGDALYTLKTSMELAQVNLAADAAKIAELHLVFAERRLAEISGLIAEGRYADIDRATQEFEYHVQQALQAMQTVAAGDPLRAQQLAARVTAALTEYARSLAGMMMTVPESTRASMQRAIDTSQGGSNLTPGEFSENENEETNDNINDDAGNLNSNDNSGQTNQNGGLINENENENDDDNGNGSTNLNSNENENRNDNDDDDEQDNNNNINDDNDDDSGDDDNADDGDDDDNDDDGDD